jgi:hypothetical protein
VSLRVSSLEDLFRIRAVFENSPSGDWRSVKYGVLCAFGVPLASLIVVKHVICSKS